VATLVERYLRLLAAITEQPLAELARTALLSPAERAALFDEPARCI